MYISRRKMQILNSFMKMKNIDFDIQIKIRKYLEYIWGKGTELEKKSQENSLELPKSLRNEVLVRSQGEVIKQNQIFVKNFSEETLRSIAIIMIQIHFSPEEWIFMVDILNYLIYKLYMNTNTQAAILFIRLISHF
jgi:hypothetical protein